MIPIRPVLIAKEVREGGPSELVVLKIFSGGRSYLAALTDQQDHVVEWLEIWVQCSHELDESPLARSASICNASNDRQWLDAADAMRSLSPDSFLETDWATKLSSPLVVDLSRHAVVRLVHPTSKIPLELCRDDAVLKSGGLGAYSSTLERWFFSKSTDGKLSWLSIRDLIQSDANETIALPEGGSNGPVVHFNIGAGIMLLRRYYPVSLDGFLDSLTTEQAADEAKSDISSFTVVEQDILNNFQSRNYRTLHAAEDSTLAGAQIRIQLWLSIVQEAFRLSSQLKKPFFNLSTDSFRISFNAPPPLSRDVWPFRAELVHPGDSTAIRIGNSDAGFAPLRGTLASNHAMPKFGGFLEGSGTLRIRQVNEIGDGRMRMEGILDGTEFRNTHPGSYVWVQTIVDARPLSFYAKIEGDKGNNRTGTTFSVPSIELAAGVANRLKAAARQPCQFVILQPVDPVFDIYSLGVIGVRIFLANGPFSVGEFVDDLFELAAVLPRGESTGDLRRLVGSTDLSERIRRLLNPPTWGKDSADSPALAESVWLAILRELVDFVAIEVHEQYSETPGASQAEQTWLEPLAVRLASLEQLSHSVSRQLRSPRQDFDEVARVVHSFV